MNELNNTLFALLRSIVLDEKPDKKIIQEIDNEKIEKLYSVSKRHDMAQLIGPAIEKCSIKAEGEIAQKLAKAQLMAAFRCEKIVYELERIKATLSDGGIDHIPLKGAVLRSLYPEPWMRTSSDIDVLVRESDLEAAKALLCERLGYVFKEKESKHDISLYSESGVLLELHYCIREDIDGADRILDRVWSYSSSVGNGYEYVMNTEFLVFYLTVHALCHFGIGGCGIRPVCDLYLCRHKLGYDERKVLELCREAKIETFYKEIMNLSEFWFGDAEINELTERLECYILTGGLFGTVTSHIAVRRTVEGSKFRFAGKRIFASYNTLRKRYPSLKNRVWIPIYQVRRWIDVILQGRYSVSMNELKTNSSINDAKVDEISNLMKDLEISEHIK